MLSRAIFCLTFLIWKTLPTVSNLLVVLMFTWFFVIEFFNKILKTLVCQSYCFSLSASPVKLAQQSHTCIKCMKNFDSSSTAFPFISSTSCSSMSYDQQALGETSSSGLKFLLVDFGLAQRINASSKSSSLLSAPSNAGVSIRPRSVVLANPTSAGVDFR